ncbi:MAG TPA: hypothetical protein VIT20_06245 [Propionibacteriaceae bacterium]
MASPFTDIVVLLPGIMGSELSQHGKPVWAAKAGAAIEAVRTFGGSIRQLTLPPGVGDAAPDPNGPGGGVVATGLFPDIHVIPGLWTAHLGYGLLEKWLQNRFELTRVTADGPPGNYLPFAYDWRLSVRYNGELLARQLDDVVDRWRELQGPYAEAKVTFIAHSMGGLVARWAIAHGGLASRTRRLVTLATPHRGSMLAVDKLCNGVRAGWGPLQINLDDFARSLPGLHHLLPAYACMLGGESLRTVDQVELPSLKTTRVRDAMTFYAELDEPGASPDWDFIPYVGMQQLTSTTGLVVGPKVTFVDLIDDLDEGGDGTVPRLSATPSWLSPSDPIVHYVTDKHGAVQSNQTVIDDLEAILTARDVPHRGPTVIGQTLLDVRVPDVVEVGAELPIQVVIREGPPAALRAVLLRDDVQVVERQPLAPDGTAFRAAFGPQPEGLYSVRVESTLPGSGVVPTVTSPFAVWGAGAP